MICKIIRSFLTVFLGFFASLLSVHIQAAPGDLDTTFDVAVQHIAFPGDCSVDTIVVQPDGKIIIGGYFDNVEGSARNNMARLLPDGTLDSTFNPNVNGQVRAIILLQGGDMLISGSFSSVGGVARPFCARIKADGTLDTAFDANVNGEVSAILAHSYGWGILIGGSFTSVGGIARNYLARIDYYDGSVDPTFDPAPDGPITALIENEWGQQFVSGTFANIAGSPYGSYASFTYESVLDTTFTGITALPASPLIVKDAQSRLIVKNGTSLGRFFPHGGVELTFAPSLGFDIKSLVLQADGSMLVSGASAAVIRLTQTGSVDPSFISATSGTFSSINCCALQADGQVLIGGSLVSGTRNIQRLQNSPAIDTLTATGNEIRWQRGGSAPEISLLMPVIFEMSTDNGATWGYVGRAEVRNGNTLVDRYQNLPSGCQIRGYAEVSSGLNGASRGIVSSSSVFTYLAPEINITGNATSITDGDTIPDLADHTDFGTATGPGGTVTRTFTIENSGPGPLAVSNISVSANAPFSISGITLPALIPTNTSATFTVTYLPAVAGAVEATLTITSDDMDEGLVGPYTFKVRGTAYPQISIYGNGYLIANNDVTPRLADNTDLGSPSTPGGYVDKSFYIENTGAAPLHVSLVSLYGHVTDFQRGPNQNFYVASGASQKLVVRFTPTASGIRSVELTVDSNDPVQSSYAFAIRGSAAPEINVQGNEVDILAGDTTPSLTDNTHFGPTDIISGQATRTYTIQNIGTSPLSLTSLNISGTHSTEFTISGLTLPTTVAAGSSKTFTVTFDPSQLGDRTASITVVSSDTDESTYDFAVQGQGALRFATPSDTPISSNGVSISSDKISFILDHSPLPGAQLKVIDNTSLGFITGSYSNLQHGDEVVLPYSGIDYYFVANYYGGDGNDLVLQWANMKLYSWGAAANGRLGDTLTIPATPVNKTSPVTVISSGVLAERKILSIASGGMHTLALLSDGNIAAWGMDTSGQLGNDTAKTDSPVPVLVDKSATSALYNKKVVAIAAGYNFSLALCSDNTLVAWGENGSGQLGFNNLVDQPIPVAVKTTASAPASALAGKTVVRIAAGPAAYHSLALCTDNVTGAPSMVAWGRNTARCLGHNVNVASVAYPVLVTETGALINQNILAMTAGTDFSMVLCSDKTSGASSIAVWGDNSAGRLGSGLTSTPGTADSYVPVNVNLSSLLTATPPLFITAIAAGSNHGMALRSDGKVITWGSNAFGKLGTNTSTTTTYRTMPTLVSTSASSPASALYSRTVLGISAGENHCYALCRNEPNSGQSASFFMTSWGENAGGQLGQGNTTTKIFPGAAVDGAILAGYRFASVSSGSDHSVTLLAEPDMADSDNDGLPDFWEILYGLNPNDSNGVNGASGDGDGDNQSNLREYVNNTPPNQLNPDPGGPGDPGEPNPENFVLSWDSPRSYLIYSEISNSGVFRPSSAEGSDAYDTRQFVYTQPPSVIPSISSMKASLTFPSLHVTNSLWEKNLNESTLILDDQFSTLSSFNGSPTRTYQWWKSRIRLQSNVNLPQGHKVTCLRVRQDTISQSTTTWTLLGPVTFSIPKNGKISQELPLMLRAEPPQPAWSHWKGVATYLMSVAVTSQQAENNNCYDILKHDETLFPRPGNVKATNEAKAMDNALRLYFEDCADEDQIVARTDVSFDMLVGNANSNVPGLGWNIVEKPPGSPDLVGAVGIKRSISNVDGELRGGLYRLRLNGTSNIEPQIWLPLAGPDITAFWQSEITYFKDVWGPAYRQKMLASVQPLIDAGSSSQAIQIWLQMATMDMMKLGVTLDWVGTPKGQYSPCGGPNTVGDEHRLTIAGVVIDFRKRNNMMYGLIGTQMGLGIGFLAVAADSPFATGAPDDEFARESYFAGSDLSAGADLAEVMHRRGRYMQRTDSWSRKEWPSWETTDQTLTRAQDQLLQDMIQP